MCVSASVALCKRRARGLRIRQRPVEPRHAAGSRCPWGLALPEASAEPATGVAVRSNPKRCGCPFDWGN